ncbi:MAG: polymer-forming cytoskeletal protein [Kiritimatiellia bacterium]
MARSDKVSEIDGFTSVQAARHSRKSGEKPQRAEPAANPPRRPNPAKPAARPMRIGHTIVPEKHEIICYECGYAFTLTGRLQNTVCPKCHNYLEMTSHTVEGRSISTLKTIGTVEIKPDAVLDKAEITAGEILLAGNAEEGILRAFRCLELRTGAKFDVSKTNVRDLRIAAGAAVSVRKKLNCRNLTVNGRVSARITVNGIAVIKPGGLLKGEIKTSHLIVEEGGGLKAKMVVKPE